MANTFPFSDPIGVSRDTGQGIGLEAIDHRRGNAALLQPSTAILGVKRGIVPDADDSSFGVMAISGLQVTMAGGWYVADRGQGPYIGQAHRSWTVTLDDGDATHERIDRVALRTRDPAVDGSVPESAFPVVFRGTPAATPVPPSLGAGDIPVRSFRVGSGSSLFRTIRSHSDEREWVLPRGATALRKPGDNSPPLYVGQLAWNLANGELEVGAIDGNGNMAWSAAFGAKNLAPLPGTYFETGYGLQELASGSTVRAKFGRTSRPSDVVVRNSDDSCTFMQSGVYEISTTTLVPLGSSLFRQTFRVQRAEGEAVDFAGSSDVAQHGSLSLRAYLAKSIRVAAGAQFYAEFRPGANMSVEPLLRIEFLCR